MPKTTAKVIGQKITPNGEMFAKLQFNAKLPRVGDLVSVKWGSIRSGQQNCLYWLYLNWLVKEAGLKEQGHFSAEGLHEDLKAYFLSEKKYDRGMFKVLTTESTTDLTKGEFATYMDEVDTFIVEFFKVDTSPFWKTYQENYGQYGG